MNAERRDRLAAVPHRLPAEVAGLVEIQIEHATVPAALPASAKVGRRPPSGRREYGRQPTVAFRQSVRTLQKKGARSGEPGTVAFIREDLSNDALVGERVVPLRAERLPAQAVEQGVDIVPHAVPG